MKTNPPTHTHNTHHIADEDLLFSYAAGTLDEARSLIIATHLALSPDARRIVAEHEAICGEMMNGCDPARLSKNCLDAVLDRLEEEPQEYETTFDDIPECKILPNPLRSYLGCNVKKLRWRRTPIKGVRFMEVKLPNSPARVSMMRIDPGARVPTHSHDGPEMTLIIKGGYTDETGHYTRGCFTVYDAGTDHTLVADSPDGCVCLTVRDGPLKVSGPLGRLVNWLIRKY